MWWGKLIGTAVGFYPGGMAGMAFGFLFGHLLDRWLKRWRERWSGGGRRPDHTAYQVFFRTTFQCLGHLAKAKGRVAESDIDYARRVMDRLGLDAEQRQQAMASFTTGKQPDFDVAAALSALRSAARRYPQLIHLFLETQIGGAYADGQVGASDQAALKTYSRALGVSAVKLQWLHARVAAQLRAQQQATQHQGGQVMSLAQAYRVLAVTAEDSDKAVKQAYRRAMSQHHPDKLMSQGLSEAQQRSATEKVHAIQRAYEVINTHRHPR